MKGQFLHPGFPRIGAIQKFRDNVKKELDKLDVDDKIRNMPAFEAGKVKHSGRNALKMAKNENAFMTHKAYFDKSAFRSLHDHINKEIVDIMRTGMFDAMEMAVQDTSREIMNQRRNFKSKIKPRTKASGDIYERIAESLNYEAKTEQGNQFASFTLGSEGEFGLDGVMGSRGVNLIKITEDGTSPFFAHLVSSVFDNPAKRNFKET